MPVLEPLHTDTLLRVFQLVTAMLAVATLGGAWHLKADRALWYWAGAFAAAALTQGARVLVFALQWPVTLLSVGHLGGLLSALMVLLGLRTYLGLPLRCRVPLLFTAAASVGAFALTALTGVLWPSLILTLLASAVLTIPASRAALRAWREQRGFPLGLLTAVLVGSAVVEVARAVAVSPLVSATREQLMTYNAFGLLCLIGLVIGQALAMLLLMQDRALRQIERLIEVDVLTGLLNRRGFDERLRRLMRRGGPQPPLLAVLDVDHFKRINDTHGHSVGDAVLSRVGERLRGVLRPQDLAVRLGGEEFAVIWLQPEAGAEARLGERLRLAIAALPFETSAGPLSVTASIGVAQARGPEEAPEALFSRADAALYEAKRSGRDRVVLAG
ncbi:MULTISPECIES: GGDEF domain-containing protein [Roseateles]|uniref:diguanylate cyclase n=1 Tax=Pelomonas caseinilytica TaxID=2906763 RepID=A0ABS8XIJ7_9BURK|nr:MULTISPECIES: GGDEF domain-containing protein [unclassified Roseateles]MCE4539555.1 GGDEF domain-containing protein [Pelomonas sp. P7]HEV6967465.1 GGDEF domain-containing protein [Roseateles sp.]